MPDTPYHHTVGWDEIRQRWVASVVEVPGLFAFGADAGRALAKLLVDVEDIVQTLPVGNNLPAEYPQ